MPSCLFSVNNCILKLTGSIPNIIEYANTNIASDLIGEPLKVFRKEKKGTSEAVKPPNAARQGHLDIY